MYLRMPALSWLSGGGGGGGDQFLMAVSDLETCLVSSGVV